MYIIALITIKQFSPLSSLTCNSEPADLLPWLAVLPHEEGVGGASALQETPLVTVRQGDKEEQET